MIVKQISKQQQDKKVYSAPRRFDLATLFVVTIVYSLMFGVLTAFELSPRVIVCVAGFLSAVGIAQAVLFRGKKPRLASVIAGGIALPIVVQALAYGSGLDSVEVASMMFLNVPFGLVAGYLCGTLVGGVFLAAESLRTGRGDLG